MKKLDDKKICFITCVNDDFMYDECQFYLQRLDVPQGMSVEVLDVRGATSMTAGYQAAMDASDAKYKIYLHQDSFIVNRNCLQEMLDIFVSQPKIGMIGVVGAVKLNRARPVWWENSTRCGKVYSKKSPEEIQLDVYGDFPGRFKDVAVVDGIFMATQYDLPWRSDLFADWHLRLDFGFDIDNTVAAVRSLCLINHIDREYLSVMIDITTIHKQQVKLSLALQ